MNITKARISNRQQLRSRIARLNTQMHDKEAELKRDVKEVHESLQLPNMLHKLLKDFKGEHSLRASLGRMALDVGAHMAIDKLVLHKKRGFGSYVISAAVRKVLSNYLAKHNLP